VPGELGSTGGNAFTQSFGDGAAVDQGGCHGMAFASV
jgi:hypothetical protein